MKIERSYDCFQNPCSIGYSRSGPVCEFCHFIKHRTQQTLKLTSGQCEQTHEEILLQTTGKGDIEFVRCAQRIQCKNRQDTLRSQCITCAYMIRSLATISSIENIYLACNLTIYDICINTTVNLFSFLHSSTVRHQRMRRSRGTFSHVRRSEGSGKTPSEELNQSNILGY